MSCNNVNRELPFGLDVAAGKIPGVNALYKFGDNPAITNVEETIWTQGGIYVYPTSAEAAYISSTDANDTSAGTGARTVKVYGLDANWELQEETVTLNGQTQVRVGASLTWIRIFRAFVVTVGSGGTAAGDIYIGQTGASGGVPTGNIYANLNTSNQTQLALWTVPAGYTFYMDKLIFSVALSTANNYATVKLNVRPDADLATSLFRTTVIQTVQSNQLTLDFDYPIVFTEKTDLQCRAVTSSASATAGVSASFEGVYILNG